MTGGNTDATALASVGRTGEMLAVEVIMNDVGDRTDREENQPFSGKAIRWESADILKWSAQLTARTLPVFQFQQTISSSFPVPNPPNPASNQCAANLETRMTSVSPMTWSNCLVWRVR